VEAAATLSAGSVKVVPHCVDPDLDGHLRPPLSEKRPPTALSVARLDNDEQYKGLDTVLHAWPTVNRRLPDAELVVVGEGADRPRLERIASVLGVKHRVRFRGRISDEELQAEYAGADVFVLPSRCRLQPQPEGEGFGLVFAEGGRGGLAVVAGDAGGASEVVVDGKTGILVDPDEPDQVASATIRVLSDGELGRTLGEAGRARALDEFSYGRFRDAIGSMINSVFEGKY
jgi:phosphatidylinositol alpha-1,6-mannosyltransferase